MWLKLAPVKLNSLYLIKLFPFLWMLLLITFIRNKIRSFVNLTLYIYIILISIHIVETSSRISIFAIFRSTFESLNRQKDKSTKNCI